MRRSTVLFVVCILLLAAAALAIRVPRLSVRPMHGDEANQAVKAGLLLETGVYRYDPSDHHGPILYWLTLPSLWLNGTQDFAHSSEFAYRIVPVVFGAGLIVLLLLVADGIGRPAALVAGALSAISPALVFYSRYYIQETLLVFFTLAAIGAAWRYVRTPSIGWALAAGVCVGLMHTTKETWIIAAAAMGMGAVLAITWTRWRDGSVPSLRPCWRPWHLLAAAIAACAVAVLVYSAGGADWRAPVESVRAYASYWQRGRGAGDAGIHAHPWYWYLQLLLAYRPARGFFWSEAFIVGLAAIGGVAALVAKAPPRNNSLAPVPRGEGWGGLTQKTEGRVDAADAEGQSCQPIVTSPACGRGPDVSEAPMFRAIPPRLGNPLPGLTARPLPEGEVPLEAEQQRKHETFPSVQDWGQGRIYFGRFLAFYTPVLTALYAAITYKTPWCLLSFLTPMILLAGIGVAAILRWMPNWPAKTLVALLLVAGAAHLGRESYQLNFRFFADLRNPYVYAHSSGDVVELAKQMERLAQASPDGHDLVIHVVTPENYWPLPWYLRQFNRNHIGYWQDVSAWRDDTRPYPPPPVIMLAAEVQAEVDAHLRAGYNQQMMYGLRPGVLLQVYVREDLWQAFTAAAAK